MTMEFQARRRAALRWAAAAAALAATPVWAQASDWPSKPIKLIVPFPAGGPADVMGRLVAQVLGTALKATVVVENKAGAGGNLGTDQIAKAAPDGYTLGLSAVSSLAIAPTLQPKLPYNVERDVTPISLVGVARGALVAHPSAPFNDLKGLIAYAKANPGKLAYGSSGVGTSNHLQGEYLSMRAGIELLHIPYKGTAPLAQDLLGGAIPMAFESSLVTAGPNVKTGKLKAIAITAHGRAPLLPNVPTMEEQGVSPFDMPTWFGLVGPAGLPKALVTRLEKVLAEGLKTPAMQERFAAIGADTQPGTSAAFASYIREETQRYAKIIQQAKVTLD